MKEYPLNVATPKSLSYPRLIVNLNAIRNNAACLCRFCGHGGVNVAGVIKGAGGALPVVQVMLEGGCRQIASSRVSQLRRVKKAHPECHTLLIRIPMASEIKDVVECCDYSLNSEEATLELLETEASSQGKCHNVLLMYELGDRREGISEMGELVRLARRVEFEFQHLHLAGIGTNLSCIYAIRPTRENMTQLVEAAENVEREIGRQLEMISGGGTTVLPLLTDGSLPQRINHLRIGEAIIDGMDLPAYWDCHIPGMRSDCLLLQAQIVECNVKDAAPEGIQVTDAFGQKPPCPPHEMRRFAILAVGRQDLGDPLQLVPTDPDIRVTAASSDHTIVDISACSTLYRVGDILKFHMYYECMLFSFLSGEVEKEYCNQ